MAHRIRVVALAAASGALVLAPAAEGGIGEANGIVFDIRTSQGLNSNVLFKKRKKKGSVSVGVDVVMNCTSAEMGSFTRRLDEIVQGRPHGNSFSGVWNNPLNSPDVFETATASASFSPGGSRGGLPRWRKVTGTMRFTTGFMLLGEACDSGPVSFTTTSSHRAKLIPNPFSAGP